MTYRDWLRNPRCRHCGSSKLTIGYAPASQAEKSGPTIARSRVTCGGCGIMIATWRDFLVDADPPILPVVRSAAKQCASLQTEHSWI
jgi:hypothetical protein